MPPGSHGDRVEGEPWHTRGPVDTPRFKRLAVFLSPVTSVAIMATAVGLGLGLPRTSVTLVIQTVQNMSPRLIGVIAHFHRSLAVVGLVTGTAVYALVGLAQIRPDETPRLSVTLAVVLVVVDTAVLLQSLTGLRHLVTGEGVARAVGELNAVAIDAAFPRNGAAADPGTVAEWATSEGVPFIHTGRPGVVQSVDERRLLGIRDGLGRTRLARHRPRGPRQRRLGPGTCARAAGTTSHQAASPPGLLRPRGPFPVHRPGSGVRPPAAGRHRHPRALSPAVNDPTTAVQALDQIEEALVRLVTRPLGVALVVDGRGTPRLCRPAPGWPELVSLALDEILHTTGRRPCRSYGAYGCCSTPWPRWPRTTGEQHP